MRLSIKALHDPGDANVAPAVIVADGKSYNIAQGETVDVTVTNGLSMNLKAVDERGSPLGNTVSDPRQPGVGKSVTDPRLAEGSGGHSTQHEPTSPPNPGPGGPKPAPAPATPPAPAPNNEPPGGAKPKAQA